jgi:hypothetical protein
MNTPAPTDVAPASISPPAEQDALQTDVPCRNCRFNLRGLSPQGNCPECGLAIAQTIRRDAMALAPREYIMKLRRGAALVAFTPIGWMAAFAMTHVDWIVFDSDIFDARNAFQLMSFALLATLLWGYWLLASADTLERTGAGEALRDPRPAMRGGIILILLAAVVVLARPIFPARDPGFTALAGAAGVVGIVGIVLVHFGSMTRVIQLAAALPDEPFSRQARTYRWLLPVIALLGALVMVGPLVAVVIYVLIMNKLRVGLNRVMEAQAQQSMDRLHSRDDGATGHPEG